MHEFEYGKTRDESFTDAVDTEALIPEFSKMKFSITANRYESSIPYTARLTKFYFDGTSSVSTVEGQYDGVNLNEVSVQYNRIVYLTQSERENERLEIDEIETETSERKENNSNMKADVG